MITVYTPCKDEKGSSKHPRPERMSKRARRGMLPCAARQAVGLEKTDVVVTGGIEVPAVTEVVTEVGGTVKTLIS